MKSYEGPLKNLPAEFRTRQDSIALAHAAGVDAGNRHACKHGRTAWSQEDYATAAAEENRIRDAFGIDPPPPERAAS